MLRRYLPLSFVLLSTFFSTLRGLHVPYLWSRNGINRRTGARTATLGRNSRKTKHCESNIVLESYRYNDGWTYEKASAFWGQPRTEEEILEFVTQAMSSVDEDFPFPLEESNCGLRPQPRVLSSEPPLVVIPRFLPPAMCQSIIAAARDEDSLLKRSTMGTSQESTNQRTSSTAWLGEHHCTNNDKAVHALRRMAELVSRVGAGLPPSHQENCQVVRYLPGEEFRIHTDHLESFNDLDCRGRLCTFLLYLQKPKQGGETVFFEFTENGDDNSDHFGDDSTLGKVSPEEGSCVMFWNTLERPGSVGYNPSMFLHTDIRLRHAGAPVIEGEKWVCNRWVHPIPFLSAGVRGLSDGENEDQKTMTMVGSGSKSKQQQGTV